jgi:hypothetical protein
MPETLEIPASSAASSAIVEAVMRLGKAVHKTTIYPEGHPAIPIAVRHFLDALRGALEDAPAITLGVARDRLLLDGEPIEARSSSVSWLAERLFEAGIVALELGRDLTEPEGIRFAHWVARAGAAGADPDDAPSFGGITLTRYDFGRVRFNEDPAAGPAGRDSPVRLWLTLMSGLFGGRDTDAAGRMMDDPEALAKEFSARLAAGDSAGAAAMASRVIGLGAQIHSLTGPMRDAVRRRVGKFVEGLSPALRSEILRVDATSSAQKLEFLKELVDVLPSTTVVEVLASLDSTGARVPHQFITLMNKLIQLSAADSTLKAPLGRKLEKLGVPREVLGSEPETVQAALSEVLKQRFEKDYNPAQYQALLEDLSKRRVAGSAAFISGSYGDAREPEGVRAHLAEIALMLLVTNPEATEAPGYVKCLDDDAPRAFESGRFEQVHDAAFTVREIKDRLPGLPDGLRELFDSYLSAFTREDRIERILEEAMASPGPLTTHTAGLFRLAGREGGVAALRKLAGIEEGGPAPEAERLRELLALLDPEEFSAAVARLRPEGWAVLRPLFAVLQKIGGSRAVEMAVSFVGSEDPRIRIEALRVLLAEDDRPGQAERYIERGLFDESVAVAGATLGLARQRCTPAVTAMLGSLVREERGARDDELRIRAIHALGGFATPDARDILIAGLSAQKIAFFVGQVRIACALEESLARVGDEVSTAALKRWRRSPARWISLLLVQGRVKAGGSSR